MIKKALTKSYQSSTKAGRICSSMLDLARGESSSSVIEIQKLVEEVLTVLARDPQKDGIALRVQVQPGLSVSGDHIQLEQVLLNLLINARHAMLGRGGSLTVKAQRTEGSDEIRIQVIDTGPGFLKSYCRRFSSHSSRPREPRKRARHAARGLAWRSAKRSSSTTEAGSKSPAKSAAARPSASISPPFKPSPATRRDFAFAPSPCG